MSRSIEVKCSCGLCKPWKHRLTPLREVPKPSDRRRIEAARDREENA